MKKSVLYILYIMLMVIVFSCGKTDDKSCVFCDSKVDDVLYAKVENASKYKNVVAVKLRVYSVNAEGYIELARGDWNGNGFTIVLPKTIDTNHLFSLMNNHGLPTTQIIASSTATINNPNAKIADAYFVGVDKEGNVVVYLDPLKIDEHEDIRFRYVTSNVTVCGYSEHSYGINITNIFSIEWKKGWNVLWISASELDGRTIMKWLTIPVNSLKWYGADVLERPITY